MKAETNEGVPSIAVPVGKERKKNRFILLRADGLSYDAIAKTLRVSKNTLIGWAKEVNTKIAIENQRNLNHDRILSEYNLRVNDELKALGKMKNRLDKEIEGRDLDKLGVKDLVSLRNDTNARIGQLRHQFEFLEENPDKWENPPAVHWGKCGEAIALPETPTIHGQE